MTDGLLWNSRDDYQLILGTDVGAIECSLIRGDLEALRTMDVLAKPTGYVV
jgi:hypothetical protein